MARPRAAIVLRPATAGAADIDLSDVPGDLRRAVGATLHAAGVDDGHLGVEIVGKGRMRTLNYAARGVDEATDVLAFPIDDQPHDTGPRELGDVFICPEQATDVTEAAIHGTLHLCGFDHEADQGADARAAGQDHGLVVSKAGFVGLAGRPNVGKSTLVNAIVGSHVAIVSERPQTTRRAIRGVATDLAADWQLIMTDLPGVQRPRDALTERMQRRVEREIADSDAVLFVINAEQGVGPGDRFISKALLQSSIDTPVVCAVNKVDRLNNAETAAVLAAVGEIGGVDEIFPVSARKGHGLEPMISKLIELLPGEPLPVPAGAALGSPESGAARGADPRAGSAPHP